jgi:hypothetical protein
MLLFVIRPHVFMIFWPTLRFLTGPFPAEAFAARFFAAVGMLRGWRDLAQSYSVP